MKPHETQLVVVGAGPVGLFAGLCAARRGLEVEVLDQSWRGHAPGHAAILHPSSIRLFADLGLGDTLIEAGRAFDKIRLHVDGVEVRTLELASPALAISQRTLEEKLLGALRAENVELRVPVQATTIEQGDRVHLRIVRRELVTPLGPPAQESEWQPLDNSMIVADFLIGADGYDSRVRGALGIEMIDVGSVETFAMFEIADVQEPDGTMDLSFSQGLGSTRILLPNGRARWGFQIASDLHQPADIDRLRRLRDERAAWHRGWFETLDWGTVTQFERRVARPFGRKQAWLCGDAAHVTSPFGGQSLNVGLSEAHGLVGRMADCLQGKKKAEALVLYEAQRQREWHKLLGVNVHFDLLSHAPAWLASLARRIMPALPASGRDLDRLLEQLGLVVR